MKIGTNLNNVLQCCLTGCPEINARSFGRYLPLLFFIQILFVTSIFGKTLPEITVRCSKNIYCVNDTVILAVQVKVPEGYVLVGNPKGPGIGRPMKIWITSPDSYVRWLEVRKPQAGKYGPPFGAWVWAYSGATSFFCVGVITDTTPEVTVTGQVSLEYLICSSECRLVTPSIPFSLRIVPTSAENEHFHSQTDLFDLFKTTTPMMALERRR